MGRLVARIFLGIAGWKLAGDAPAVKQRYVLIAAPHTSNWDLPYLIAFALLCQLRISFMAKHSLFKPPFGWFMRLLGGIPVVRHRRGNLVDEIAEWFSERDELILVVPAEGTRSRTDYWKSGFYHIARSACVPIVCSYLDYEKRLGGFGPVIVPSGDVRKDMDEIRSFYAGKVGAYPELFAEPRLREEESPARLGG
jgi:1-acyl-sn-glycerol-3-phosphate acyltransferase